MECLMGIQFKDFVMIAADQTTSFHTIVINDSTKSEQIRLGEIEECEYEKKIWKLTDNFVMAIVGESGDTNQFSEYIVKNLQLYKIRNGYEMGPEMAAYFTRKNLENCLRSRSPYNVNMLLGGYDMETGPSLYFIDYLATCVKVPHAVHGFGGFLTLSILDEGHYCDLNEDEAYALMKSCVVEIQKRLIINLPNFEVVVVNKDGIKKLPRITLSANSNN